MYKVGICDDESIQVDILKDFVNEIKEEHNFDVETYCAYSGEEFLKICHEHKIDVAFLDIEMSGMDGLELGKAIREENKDIVIIYITGYKDYALESYSIQAFNYIIKPITKDSFSQLFRDSIKRVEETKLIREAEKKFVIKHREGITTVGYNDIYYIEKDAKNINIICKEDIHTYRSTIKEVRKNLDSDQFLQCHQGYIINVSKITNRKENALECGDIKTLVPIGKTYRKSVLEYIEKKLLTRW